MANPRQKEYIIFANKPQKQVEGCSYNNNLSSCVVLSDFYGHDILQDVGYEAKPRGKRSRKRRRRREDKDGDFSTNNGESEQEETEWQGLKQFLDPNPQLKGTSRQDDDPKVSP